MGCKRNVGCIIPAIISVIIAVIVGFTFSTTVVTGLVALLYTIIGVAAFFLITLIVIALLRTKREKDCVCENGTCLLFGSLGAIVTSAITIALTVSATITAILVGIVTFFIVLAIIEFFLLISCIAQSNCNCKCND